MAGSLAGHAPHRLGRCVGQRAHAAAGQRLGAHTVQEPHFVWFPPSGISRHPPSAHVGAGGGVGRGPPLDGSFSAGFRAPGPSDIGSPSLPQGAGQADASRGHARDCARGRGLGGGAPGTRGPPFLSRWGGGHQRGVSTAAANDRFRGPVPRPKNPPLRPRQRTSGWRNWSA